MFGRKKARAFRAAQKAEERAAKMAKFRDQLLARQAQDRIADSRPAAEKIMIRANSLTERAKSTPSV